MLQTRIGTVKEFLTTSELQMFGIRINSHSVKELVKVPLFTKWANPEKICFLPYVNNKRAD